MVGSVRATCGAVAILVLVWVPMAHADQNELASGARTFIEGLTETAISQLTDPTLPVVEQEARFQEHCTLGLGRASLEAGRSGAA